MNEEFVTITKKEYDKLCDDEWFLACLRQVGVDNWMGWDEACRMFHGETDE